ncbi:two-component regulator propeller domain-containing protein [Sulfidibacter corallicola]|uniref:histidine kinase n=1 Tax=Sulfidibacter corallicola TaxID=2818388 RepID=A0A8A4TNG9_SULCO|nr:two-component regulator propeller domain-containing protein [Sulfidibacter corallicola]QTD50478.1 response regulator [Sulfidibacter corallicola]
MFQFGLLLSTAAFFPHFAQDRYLRFEHVGTNQGLSHPTIHHMAQDRFGYLWFATQDGLNRYDGYHFKVYRHDPNRSDSLPDSYVYRIYEDREGYLWLATKYSGLCRMDPVTERYITYRHDPRDPASLISNRLLLVAGDNQGRIWVGSDGAGISRLLPDGSGFRNYRDEASSGGLAGNKVRTMYQDSQDRLWFGAGSGLYRYLPDEDRFTRITLTRGDRVWQFSVYAIVGDRQGFLWLGTGSDGLIRYDPLTESYESWHHDPEDPHSLPNDGVGALWRNPDGTLWAGTDKGLGLYDPGRNRFLNFGKSQGDGVGLSHHVIQSLLQDRSGTLWAGTWYNGLNRFTSESLQFHNYRNDPKDPGSLTGSLVNDMCRDREGQLWMATRTGLSRYDSADDSFVSYRADPADPHKLPADNVYRLLSDASARLWVGTSRGLCLYDQAADRFKRIRLRPERKRDPFVGSLVSHKGDLWVGVYGSLIKVDPITHDIEPYRPTPEEVRHVGTIDVLFIVPAEDDTLWLGTNRGVYRTNPENRILEAVPMGPAGEEQVRPNEMFCSLKDRDGTIWFGSDVGLHRVDPKTGSASSFTNRMADKRSLSHNSVTHLFRDRKENLWIGTQGGGLNMLPAGASPENDGFRRFSSRDGLGANAVGAIIEDETGRLWISTTAGITVYDPAMRRFKNYGGTEGALVSYVINSGWTFDDQIYFGSFEGLTSFHPNDISKNQTPPRTAVSEFLLFNQPVPLSSPDRPTPLIRHLDFGSHLTLTHRDYVFGFGFTGLHFADPQRNRYSYKLEGFDREWVQTDARKRFATYTKLDPGTYRFHLRTANKDGVWSEDVAPIQVTIRPPPYKTVWAYLAYLVTAILVIGWLLHAQRRKLAAERELNQRLRQVDKLKDEFLANISHELRTPLNGIIGLSESIIEGDIAPIDPAVAENLEMVVSSGKRLAALVNDILDFSKLRNTHLKLSLQPVALRPIVNMVFRLSRPLLAGRPITLYNDIPTDLPLVSADENRLIQIIHNLVGNAVKFTKAGEIRASAVCEGDQVAISISDTGAGIQPEKISRIFESFEQLDATQSPSTTGTGLGLAITRQLVELHGGEIYVHSKLSVGSRFSFTLQKAQTQASQETSSRRRVKVFLEDTTNPRFHIPIAEPPIDLQDLDAPFAGTCILIVDDDDVNRRVLSNLLVPRGFHVKEADGGLDALRRISRSEFDLVLLDVMMPGMNGYEVCQKIRETHPPHDLPVVLVTALSGDTEIGQGFAVGANDFVTKPISKEELVLRVETHLRLKDMNKVLEREVASRTRDLEQKNTELRRHQKNLVEMAHRSGMSEVATNVLHTMGNTLNHLTTSVNILIEHLNNSRTVPFLEQTADLLKEHERDLVSFFESKRGAFLTQGLALIAEKTHRLHQDLAREAGEIRTGIHQVSIIVREQERHTSKTVLYANISLDELMNQVETDCERAFRTHDIELRRHGGGEKVVNVQSTKIRQVLVHLVRNGCRALSSVERKRCLDLTVRVQLSPLGDEDLCIEVRDNGIGIAEEHLSRIFTQGYTTWSDAGGLGLHYCACAIKDMGGRLHAQSDGPDKGAVFQLVIPLARADAPVSH